MRISSFILVLALLVFSVPQALYAEEIQEEVGGFFAEPVDEPAQAPVAHQEYRPSPAFLQNKQPTIIRKQKIKSIKIEGLARVSKETVVSYLYLKEGDTLSQNKINEALKRLHATSLFADVKMQIKNGILTIKVIENAIINRLAFEGNKRLKEADLSKEIQLRPRMVLTSAKVQEDVERLLNVYRRNGRYSVVIEPKVIQLEQNRLDLVFEIREGDLTLVRGITFLGNKAFDDEDLKEVLSTKETAWYKILSNNDRYDPDRLLHDQSLLRDHYMAKGYLDFHFGEVSADLHPNHKHFFLTFNVDEGKRYKIGNVQVVSDVAKIDPEMLKSELLIKSGNHYSALDTRQTIEDMNKLLTAKGFVFIDVQPDLKRNAENSTVDVTFRVIETQKVFIEEIRLSGNYKTRENVIRRELKMNEGDALNVAKVREARENLEALEYFKVVKIDSEPGSGPDKVILTIDVEEKRTTLFNFSAGYGIGDGIMGKIGMTESNFLGQGQHIGVDTTIAQRRKEVTMHFTEPYFLKRDISAGFDVTYSRSDLQRESSYDVNSIGGALRLGYNFSENLRHTVSYNLERRHLIARDVKHGSNKHKISKAIKIDRGLNTLSSVGSQFMWDRRDRKKDPSRGFQVILDNELAGLGGSARYFKTNVTFNAYRPVTESVIGSVRFEGGHNHSFTRRLHNLDRYLIGAPTIRGFNVGGIGPRDITTKEKEAIGGTTWAVISGELTVPVSFLPREFGVKGHVFADAGTLFGGLKGYPGSIRRRLRGLNKVRVSVGFGVSVNTPMGLLRFDISRAIRKHKRDEVQTFTLGAGTRLQ